MSRGKGIPSYCHHKGSGQACVWIDRKPVYLGLHGSPESKRRYEEILRDLHQTRQDVPYGAKAGCTVEELLAAFLTHARAYYVHPDGRQTQEVYQMRMAARPVQELYAGLAAEEFRPSHLRAVRDQMIAADLSKGVINHRVRRIRRIWRWAVSEELVSPGTLLALEAVPDLPLGRGLVRELPPVGPVDWQRVKRTLPHFSSPQLRTMVLLQWWMGCREEEICSVRGCDLHRTGTVTIPPNRVISIPIGIWAYLVRAKMAHRRRDPWQVYLLGPKAQALLLPWLREDPDEYLFQPREAVPRHYLTPRKARRPGEHYLVTSYDRAVKKACLRAGVEPWTPHQLRHAAEARFESAAGIEAARRLLGHTSVNTTRLYGARDLQAAAEDARKLG